MKLSVVINTKNAAKTLKSALESVKFADEIVIVDMKSTDDTVKIAKKYTSLIFAYDDVGYVEPARNFAISKASSDWILILDSDEEISAELGKVIKKVLKLDAEGKKTADCYYLPRKNMIFGKWIEKTGWWPDYVLRLFKKDHVEWSNEIHSIPITKGKVEEFPAIVDKAIIHHNYQHVDQYVKRMNKYSSIQAKEKISNEDFELDSKSIFKSFSSEFLSRLFARRGINDGAHGLSLSLLQSISQALITMKIWDEKGFPETNKFQEEELIKEITQFKKELAYWLADWQVENTTGLVRFAWKIRRKLYI